MAHRSIFKDTLRRLSLATSAFGILLSLAVTTAYSQQVHQLLYNNSDWADQNLNGTQSPIYSLAAFPTTPNDQTHVYFLTSQSGGGHVHQLFYNGVSWGDEDLTVLSGGPAAYGSVTGFSVGNYQYVYYVSQNVPRHVHQLLYNNSRWVDSDLSVLGKAKVYAENFGLVAFTTSPALHVYYQDDEYNYGGDIHQLYSTNGTTWKDEDLTMLTGASQQSAYLSSGFNVGNLQYVYYQDVEGELHQLYYNNSNWSDTDLTESTKLYSSSEVAALVIPGTKKMRLYFYSGANLHLMQLASSNGTTWTSTDLTKKSKGPTPDKSGVAILAYATTPNDGIHVFYESGNHIHQIFQPTPTTWQHEDLTALGDDFGKVVDNSALAGFSQGNYQYVFYFAQ